jgi:hypothetical protein
VYALEFLTVALNLLLHGLKLCLAFPIGLLEILNLRRCRLPFADRLSDLVIDFLEANEKDEVVV